MPQYFKQELFFRQLTDSYLSYIPEQTQNMKLLHILCTSDKYEPPLAALQPDSELFTTVLIFHQEKKWLCWKCVKNYEVRSAIF